MLCHLFAIIFQLVNIRHIFINIMIVFDSRFNLPVALQLADLKKAASQVNILLHDFGMKVYITILSFLNSS